MSFVKLTWADRVEVVELGAGGSVKVEVPAVSGLQSWQFASSGLLGVEVCDEPAVDELEAFVAAVEDALNETPAPKPAAKKKTPAKKPAPKAKTAAKKPKGKS